MSVVVSAYHDRTQAWQSRAGGGPLLRGRRYDGPPHTIHFVHGNGFCGGVYWPLLAGLLPDYGLFCHDIEGHGASEPPQHFSGTPAIMRRIEPVIADQGLAGKPLIGMGHSYGAALTLCAAAENPQRFGALVLLDPILLPPLHYAVTRLSAAVGGNPLSRGALRRRDRWESRDAVRARLQGRGIYRGWRDDAFECFVEYATRDDADGSRVLCCPKQEEAAIFNHPIYPWRAWPHIHCPVLVIMGADSYPFLRHSARLIRKRHPAAHLQAQAGGHCFMLEDPDRTAATVRDFLKSCGY
ncbi:alpha/beta fold hydrolase [Solimonas marina]|uniref:Alpha/beta hydrolase n=1 Tax=Solimonas marina TaxID=2714601 RepID=A0A970B8J3_9GAMM|nr:alpha/beta hydrolase [Solimonas marina]NKF21441.1 alpha/beta hydrolase [Solimonas marina]